jgi:proteasome lid subunit RPN8/RPN11
VQASKAIGGSKMLGKIRLLAAMLIILVPCVTKLSAETQPAYSHVTPQMMELIHAHQSVLERMNAPAKDSKPPQLDDARMKPLLTEGWRLAGEWAAAWLDRHPEPSAKDLNDLFVDFTPPPPHTEVYDPKQPELYAMEGSATSIATDVFIVTAVYENYTAVAASTFFVVARGADGHFRPLWSVKPLAEQHFRSKDEIGLWAFLGSCFYYCGPLVVDKVLPLPPSENGQPRFAIDAFQATNGNTLMKQLSVWQWNGAEAENLVIRSYKLYIDEDRGIQLIGNLLSVPTKETTSSFSSFGCCAEPRGIWTLRIAPGKVQDLGHRFLQPQIEWADRLLATSRANSPAAAGLAAPSVLAFLRNAEIEANMIDQCHVLSSGRKGAFEISFAEGTKLWFAYRLRNGQPYFTGVRVE